MSRPTGLRLTRLLPTCPSVKVLEWSRDFPMPYPAAVVVEPCAGQILARSARTGAWTMTATDRQSDARTSSLPVHSILLHCLRISRTPS